MECDLSLELLGSLRDRQTLFGDLSSSEQQSLLQQVAHEYPEQQLASLATQAFIGSVYGLITIGVRKVRKPRSDRAELFGYEDGVQQFLSSANFGRLAELKLSNTTAISTFIIGRTFSRTVDEVFENGQPNLRYPPRVKGFHIVDELQKRSSGSWDALHQQDFEEAIELSGADEAYRKASVARKLWNLHDSEQIREEQVSIEDEADVRMRVEADDNDDELVVDHSVVTDIIAADDMESVVDKIDRVTDFRKIPFDILTPTQRTIIDLWFGLGGEQLNFTQVAHRLHRSESYVARHRRQALYALRSALRCLE
jgi:hypothetical protein